MKGRVAIVTGGLRGLGRAMSLGLARKGCRVAAVGHIPQDVAEMEAAAAALQLRDAVWPLVADLRQADECDRVVDETRTRFGRVDILVNNAGLTFTYRPGALPPPGAAAVLAGVRRHRRQRDPDQLPGVRPAGAAGGAGDGGRRLGPHRQRYDQFDTMNRLGTHPYGASKAALEMATEVSAGSRGHRADHQHRQSGRRRQHAGHRRGDARDQAATVAPPAWSNPTRWCRRCSTVTSREADKINGYRFDANAWDASLPPAEAARRAGHPAGFVLHPQS